MNIALLMNVIIVLFIILYIINIRVKLAVYQAINYIVWVHFIPVARVQHLLFF